MQKQTAIGLLVIVLALAVTGCDRKTADEPVPTEAPTAENLPEDDEAAVTNADDTAVSELAGTSWRLVKIQSMNDTEEIPDDSSKYTLAFQADGRAAIQADCNRATGTYTNESPSQLQFGVMASTKAMCPPDSLHDVYMAQFEWVRSYVLEDRHLFLATMADGSIIEFEPVSTDDV